MYSSVSIFDSSDAIITHYADRDEIGKNSPAFHLKPVSGGDRDLFSFYEEEFERYWRRAVPYELDARRSGFAYERRVRRETDKIRRVSRWLDNGGTLDMPSMLVIYPTYKCTGVGETGGPLCSNCLYRRHISDRHIAPDLLEATITQAMEAGVRRIEFSGGGEPLQYRHIDRLMGFLKKVKSSHSDVRFGLLTNCIHLDEKLRGKAVGLFSYIRVSFAEGLQGERNQEALDLFRQNLGALLERQKDKDGCPRIGLKLLANKPNTQRRDGEPSRLMRDILELRSHIGGAFSKLDHIRIKAMRSSRADEYEIGEDDALRFRDEFWDHVFMTPKDHWPDDTQVDLDLRYTDAGAHSSSAGFICKLNPLVAVLDPDGKLFPCWNAVGNTAAIRQLDMADAGLKETWGDAEHKDVVRKMSVKDVCNSTSGCPCRFVEYHRIVDSEAIPCEPTIPEALNGFL